MATADQNDYLPEGCAPLGSLQAYSEAYQARYKPGDHIGGHLAGLRAVVLNDRQQRPALAPPALVPEEVRRLEEKAYIERRRDFWINEAQRLATLVREMGGDPEPSAASKPASEPTNRVEVPHAYCCNMDPATCDCVNPNHGTAWVDTPTTPSGRTDTPPAGGGAAPEGWRLMPVEPSEGMCLAGLGVDRTSVFSAPSVMRDMASSYRAMLAAAPAAPEPAAGGGLVEAARRLDRALADQCTGTPDDKLVRARFLNEMCDAWKDVRSLLSTPSEAQDAGEGWRDDPSADERWNAGLDFCMEQLCSVLGVDPKAVSWDAATETLDGDVRSVIDNILTVWAGDNWRDAPTTRADTSAEGGRDRT